ncbi:unnamed protein product [Gordionus sp. m RMFG-2023]
MNSNTELLSSNGITEAFKVVLDSEYRHKYYRLIIEIAIISEEMLFKYDKSGLLEPIIAELQSKNAWIQSNAIDMLAMLTTTINGLNYLKKKKVIMLLEVAINQVEKSAIICLILPNLIKFFASVIRTKPEYLISKYQGFLGSICLEINFDTLMYGHDKGIKQTCLSAFGIIASNSENLKTMAQHSKH